MKRSPVALGAALGVVLAGGALTHTRGQQPPAGQPPAGQPPADPDADLRQRKEVAITKGVRWLVSQQKPDGSWTYENSPFQLGGSFYPMPPGVTALCAFALLKCGVRPDDPAIQKAFQFIHAQEHKHTYAVSCVIMAIEAKASWQPPPEPGKEPAGSGTSERGRPAARPPRPTPQDLDLARRCAEFLIKNQQAKGLWRYPSGTEEDVSNTQYAMLALDAAERMNIPVPKDVYERVATRLLETQEKDGPPVPGFPVPGADKSFRELAKIQDDLEKEIRQLERRFKRDPAGRDAEGQTLDDRTQTAERGASRKIIETAERPSFKARGFPYMPPGAGGGSSWHSAVTGSMTASGVAALFICKARLEGQGRYERELKGPIDQALRDGAAWLASHYSITGNPGFSLHHYYYLYGLERAGILGVIPKFGDHDWYQDGCEHLLGAQRPEGVWQIDNGTAGPVPDTCFALLFLARGTTPVVNVPRRVMTGGSAYGAGSSSTR